MEQAKFLLDTNVCIALLKNDRHIIDQIISVGQSNCFVSEITIAELFYGAAKSGKESHFNDIDKIITLFEVLPMYPALKLYGITKASLEEKGRRLDDFDLLIGATALQNGLSVVTANVKHFNRIPKLVIENWEE